MHPWSRWYKSSTYRKPLTAPPFDQEGKLIWSDIASSTMALPYGQDAFRALALGSDPLRRKLRPLWGGSLDFQAFAASLSSRAQFLCAFRDILGGQSQCLCGFASTRTNGHEWVQQASNTVFIRGSEVVWYRNDTYFIPFIYWITERNQIGKP